MSEIVERLRATYDKVKEWPENDQEGFMNLISLRNLTPEAADEIERLRTDLRCKETEALGYLRAVGTLQERCAKLEKALKPFARIADMEESTRDGGSVIVNVSRCRDARAALDQDKGGESDGI